MKVMFVSALCFAAVSLVTMQAGSEKSVTAAQVNGTWKTKYGEFKIWALGHQRLQVEFSGVYEYKTAQGPTANTGEGSGIATIAAASRRLKAILPSSNPKAPKRNAGSRSNSLASNF